MDRNQSTPNASNAKSGERICSTCRHVFVPTNVGGRCQYCEDHRIVRNGGLGGLVEADLPVFTFQRK